ncbi:protein halfway [Drosophila navojoa]|uniref:protein halfway n=1 Tax=Drosophila navojoa TaxID=7232 RepID=UPI000847BA64|nr:protein halfway [Drosophila navojoa]
MRYAANAMIAFKDLVLIVMFAHACARPEELAAGTVPPQSLAATPAAPSAQLVTHSMEMSVSTPPPIPHQVVIERQIEVEKADSVPAVTPVASTTAVAPSATVSSELPDYLKNCFYAEEELCLNWRRHNGSDEPPVLDRLDISGVKLDDGEENMSDNMTAISAQNDSLLQSQNLQARDRDANSCQCREHPTRANSWYCCNITHISMISSCSNISKWTNLHVRNLSVQAMNLSNPIYRSLQSLAVTDGNIMQLTNAFPRHSKLKCLNISNNNISDIASRAVKDVPQLEFFGISKNLLSRVPNRNQNKHIALDISGNMRLLCEPLNEIIYGDSFNFVNPENSFCLYNATHKWFNSTNLVSVKQLESIKKCGTKCPVIPNYGNCSCNIYNMMIIQGDQSRTVCHVDCSNLGLLELPSLLPDNTFTLNISNNKISTLGDHFHTNPTYYNIVKLDADNNHISSIYEFEGTKFIEQFQRLYMRNNSLTKIPEYFLNNALMDTGIGRRIYLAENRLQCDCNSAKTLQNWLRERSTDIPDYMDIRCRNLPQSVIELQETKLCQSPPDWTDYIYYLIAAEVILLLALITKVSYDYWVFKTAGYLPWPASKMPKLPCDCLCES